MYLAVRTDECRGQSCGHVYVCAEAVWGPGSRLTPRTALLYSPEVLVEHKQSSVAWPRGVCVCVLRICPGKVPAQ